MDSRSPAKIFVFGVISINAAPESYVKFASDFNRLSRVPGFLVHVLTMRGERPQEPAYVIAEKQLCSSHYFETVLDLTFCIRGSDNPKESGFHLVRVMGSEVAGLAGFKGSIARKVAVGRSVFALRKSLASIKDALENQKWVLRASTVPEWRHWPSRPLRPMILVGNHDSASVVVRTQGAERKMRSDDCLPGFPHVA